MRVLVATSEGQGEVSGDYCWTVEGELVTPLGPECSEPGRCGCGRGFPGLASDRATSTAIVVERDGIDHSQVRRALQDSLTRGGWLQHLDAHDASELVEEHLEAIEQVCRVFPIGTIVRRAGDVVFDRSQAPPSQARRTG